VSHTPSAIPHEPTFNHFNRFDGFNAVVGESENREGGDLGAFLSPPGERIKLRGRWDAPDFPDPYGCILLEG